MQEEELPHPATRTALLGQVLPDQISEGKQEETPTTKRSILLKKTDTDLSTSSVIRPVDTFILSTGSVVLMNGITNIYHQASTMYKKNVGYKRKG